MTTSATKRAALAATGLVFLLATGACAASSQSDAAGGSGGSGGSSASAPMDGFQDNASGSTAAKSFSTMDRAAVTSKEVDPMTRSVISTGQITLHAADLPKARTRVFALVAGWDGLVADEQSSGDRKGRITDSTLKLRIPTSHFDEAMRELGTIGTVEQQSRSSKDVTTQVIDNAARVRAAKRSIASIENLLSKADKLGDVISIENNLAERQANLDSLEQQQKYLADQISLSTITVTLSLPEKAPGHKPVKAQGFLAGLSDGWHALGAAVAVVSTALGAVLPFAVVALVIGVPLWLVVRRRRPVVAPEA